MSFQPFQPKGLLETYRLSLPHWRQPGVTYFLTTRLADSLPYGKVEALREECHQWLNPRGCATPEDVSQLPEQDQRNSALPGHVSVLPKRETKE
jgi:putative transposase